MLSFIFDPIFGGLTLLFAIIAASFYLIGKINASNALSKTISNLQKEIDSLDHQAKLIIKSDMELKLYQEEVEDKFNKLTLIRNLISATINILDHDELYGKLDEQLINDLGFKKAAIFILPEYNTKLNIGFSEENKETFSNILEKKSNLLKAISVVSSDYLANSDDVKTFIKELDFKDFIFAPITIGTSVHAVFVLGKCTIPSGISEADREIFSIICMYLSQCLDNIKLFEALYHAGEELETKIKEKTFQLTKSLKEIQEMDKMKSDFISSVSHELRTPLTSIKGFSSLLVLGKFGELPPKAQERLEKIDSNVDKLVTMVNTLLDIARIESKRMEVKIIPCDLSQIAKDCCEMLMPQIAEKGLELTNSIPEATHAFLDKGLIERVFINIINNAIKFTPQGGKISIQSFDQDGKITVSIKDTGCGMEKHELEKIFTEFYRTREALSQNIKGTGLGLSLVKKIINTHGEKIWAESEPNKGTTFYFTLKPTDKKL